MPVFNEAEGIESYIDELRAEFSPVTDLNFVLVDDKSSDQTSEIIGRMNKGDITAVENLENVGHGPSTITALRKSLEIDSHFVLAVDGDGQAPSKSLREFYLSLIANGKEPSSIVYGEGIRPGSREDRIRSSISWVARALVLIFSGSKTPDANTPVRLYSKDALMLVLDFLETNPDLKTPNIAISIFMRKNGYPIEIRNVSWRPPLGKLTNIGSTWQGGKFLRIKKLSKFSLQATIQVSRLFKISR